MELRHLAADPVARRLGVLLLWFLHPTGRGNTEPGLGRPLLQMGLVTFLLAAASAQLPFMLGKATAGILTLALGAAAPHPATRPERSTQAQTLKALPSDPAPKTITNDRHYLVSNERRLDLFTADLEDRPGVYLGVGAGQNYLLAGWARPSAMILIDFDQDVVDLHQIYILFLSYAPTPHAFTGLFDDGGEDTAHALLRLAVRDPIRSTRLLSLYDRARPKVRKQIATMKVKLAEAGVEGYLTDVAQYDHIAALARSGRIVARRGDFTQPGVVRAVGNALRDQNLSVGTVYLSNIEQYFMYRAPFRANMLGLPLGERAVVLRTLPARPAGFEYIVQEGANFRTWLQAKRVYSVYALRKIPQDGSLEASKKHTITALPVSARRR